VKIEKAYVVLALGSPSRSPVRAAKPPTPSWEGFMKSITDLGLHHFSLKLEWFTPRYALPRLRRYVFFGP